MKKLDLTYPWAQTPAILQTPDEFLNGTVRFCFRERFPYLYDWHFSHGITVEKGEGEPHQFDDPANYWINTKYKIGTARLFRSIEESFQINWAYLGGGFFLHYGGLNPSNRERNKKHIFLLEFFYRSPKYLNAKWDGTQRLAGFIRHLGLMPECNYNWVVLQPVGEEVLSVYSRHYKKLGYEKTGHQTEQLKTIYKRRLGATPTELFASEEEEENRYWKAGIFKPERPKYKKEDCPWFNQLES